MEHQYTAGTGPPTCSTVTTEAGGGPLVRIGGELDGPRLHHITDAIVAAGQSANGVVRLDLRDVSFMSSTGLRALIVAQRALEPLGLQVHIANASPQPRRMLATTALEAYFHVPVRQGEPAW
jgi:anti-sigma B factor antagonist